MKRVQNFYLYSYRLTGFIFLTGLIASILWYGLSVVFFIGSSSWSVPLILSPNQEKVITHLEHLLNIEHQLTKNRTELKAAKRALLDKNEILKRAQKINQRVEESMVSQSTLYAKNSLILKEITKEKAQNLNSLNKLASEIQIKEDQVENELQMGLITKQEAISQQISLNNLRSNIIDSKAKMHELKEQSKNYANAASTLNGSAKNLLAMHKVVKKVEIERQVAELEIDTYALSENIKELEYNIKKRKRALTLMRKSPYIRATKGLTTVAFVPYKNLKRVKVGSKVYACYLDMILCYKAGNVTNIYMAEEYGVHPIFKSETKGQLIGITFQDPTDAQKKLLFLNSKPLLV